MEMGGHGVNNTLPFIVIYTICLGCVQTTCSHPHSSHCARSLKQGHIGSLFSTHFPTSRGA